MELASGIAKFEKHGMVMFTEEDKIGLILLANEYKVLSVVPNLKSAKTSSITSSADSPKILVNGRLFPSSGYLPVKYFPSIVEK